MQGGLTHLCHSVHQLSPTLDSATSTNVGGCFTIIATAFPSFLSYMQNFSACFLRHKTHPNSAPPATRTMPRRLSNPNSGRRLGGKAAISGARTVGDSFTLCPATSLCRRDRRQQLPLMATLASLVSCIDFARRVSLIICGCKGYSLLFLPLLKFFCWRREEEESPREPSVWKPGSRVELCVERPL